MSSRTLLSVQQLAARRRGQLLFRDMNFSLESGEQIMLKGPNGSGKTTLLRLLIGLGRPAAGRIGGAAVGEMLYLGHQNAHKPLLTAEENLLYGGAGLTTDRPAVRRVLQKAHLAHLADVPVARLSAGQKRALALSRLLLHPASLWLLDEPFSSLDAEASAFWSGQCQSFRDKGGGIVMAIHGAQADAPRQKTIQLSLEAA